MPEKPRTISARRREFIAKGLKIVPEDPGPEFVRLPFACDLAPALCTDCSLATCLRDDITDPRAA